MIDPTTIDSVESFIEITTRMPRSFGIDSIYRGQSDASWTLRPAIARAARTVGHESNRCALFMNQARTRHQRCPTPDDLAGWLFLMQHYGLHTRLLDWTEAPLVALFFAVEGPSESDAAVYVLNADWINKAQGHGPGMLLPIHPIASKLIAAAFKPGDPIPKVAPILAPEMDYRMLLQRSAFTIHGDGSALDAHDRCAEFLTKLVIPGTRRHEIKRQLFVLGINRAQLFPDLSNLAMHLNEGTGGAV